MNPGTNMEVIILNERNVPTVQEGISSSPLQSDATEQISAKDKELNSLRYFKKVVKASSKTMKTLFVAISIVLLIIVAFMLYFVIMANIPYEDGNHTVPHEWLISRKLWQAQWGNNTSRTTRFDPVRIIIIQHTVTRSCGSFIECVQALRNLQSYFMVNLGYDLPYNFIFGNDGRAYVGRDWGLAAAHTPRYNECSLGLGFIGNYHTDVHPTDLQIERLKLLLEIGVQEGHLHPQYRIVAARDLQVSNSPGDNLIRKLEQLEHFEPTDRFRGLTCERIYEILSNS